MLRTAAGVHARRTTSDVAADRFVSAREAEDLAHAAEFRAERHALQHEQIDRLRRELPLPQIELPFVFTPDITRPQLDALADRAHSRDRAAVTIRIDLVTDRGVVICCGSGGVGKTTTAAVVALEGARRGRNACVVTIDPARRLADALGLEHLTNEPTEIDRARWADPTAPRRADGCRRSCSTRSRRSITSSRATPRRPEQAQRILDNTFYRNVSGALGGTQEYMAMEKLHELHDDRRLRSHRRRHAADASRARLPRRAASPHRACSTTASSAC